MAALQFAIIYEKADFSITNCQNYSKSMTRLSFFQTLHQGQISYTILTTFKIILHTNFIQFYSNNKYRHYFKNNSENFLQNSFSLGGFLDFLQNSFALQSLQNKSAKFSDQNKVCQKYCKVYWIFFKFL